MVLSGQITDPHGNPVALGAVTAFDPFLSSRGTARTAADGMYTRCTSSPVPTPWRSSRLSVDTAVEDEAQSLLPPHWGNSFLRRR